MRILALFLLFAAPRYALPDAPVAKPAATIKLHFDTGWWARAQWAAMAFDYSTTGNANSECLSRYSGTFCRERDPLLRPFVGRHPQAWRLGLEWAAESTLISAIPNKRVRRVVQIGSIATNTFLGVYNLRNWH